MQFWYSIRVKLNIPSKNLTPQHTIFPPLVEFFEEEREAGVFIEAGLAYRFSHEFATHRPTKVSA